MLKVLVAESYSVTIIEQTMIGQGAARHLIDSKVPYEDLELILTSM